MKGKRPDYELRDSESYLDFFMRNTSREHYNGYKSAYGYLENFCEEQGYEVESLDTNRAREFCDYLKSQCGPKHKDLSEERSERHVEDLGRLFGWIAENTQYLDWQPFDDVLQKYDPFDYDDRTTRKRELELHQLREAIYEIVHPTRKCLVMLLAKTGLRLGEAQNLDYRDIHLDHPISAHMPAPRKEIADIPDTLYVDSSISEGDEVNGEVRNNGNKDHSYREVPIDQELKQVLAWYIAMSPVSASPASPLFRKLRDKNVGYERPNIQHLWQLVVDWTRKNDWWIEPNHELNVTPHWFRHWFTTVLRSNIDSSNVMIGGAKEYVQGLRGDAGEGVIETYSHEWATLCDDDDPQYDEIYKDAMPSLLCHNSEISQYTKRDELTEWIGENIDLHELP